MSVIQLGGVYGVGKTTKIAESLQLTSREVSVLKGSIILARILGVDVESLSKVDPVDKEVARKQMFEELATARNGIRDGHYSVYAEGGYEFPFDLADREVVDVAVLLTACAETVQRRRLEIARERPTDIHLIEEHLEIEKYAAVSASQQLNVPLIMIRNEDEDRAEVRLAEILDQYID